MKIKVEYKLAVGQEILVGEWIYKMAEQGDDTILLCRYRGDHEYTPVTFAGRILSGKSPIKQYLTEVIAGNVLVAPGP